MLWEHSFYCLLSRLVNISSCFLVSNLLLLMWAYSFVDLHCIVLHALEHVLGERDSFILDHVIGLFPLLNNIQMITWLKFDAYISHLDSPLIILDSFWFSLLWPFLIHLSLPSYHPFLESHEWDSQWDICFVYESSFEDSIVRSWRPLPCKCFFPLMMEVS